MGTVFLWGLLWAIWLIVNMSLSADVAVTGAIISLPIALIYARRSETWDHIRLAPRGIYHFAAYTLVFFKEMVLANIKVMRLVYSPTIDIRPGVVRIGTRLKSPIGRLALANSIALTPGSLVLDVADDTLLIHWLDVETMDPEDAAQIITGPYEKHLENVFG